MLEKAPAQSPDSCFVCALNEEFFDLLGDADFRPKARLLVVAVVGAAHGLEALGHAHALVLRRLPLIFGLLDDIVEQDENGNGSPVLS